MIPPKYVEELKNEPNERADFPATFVEVCQSYVSSSINGELTSLVDV